MTQGGGLVGLAGRLERRSGLLAAAKLANVVLAMAWGFVVTFVFVRLLPLEEFRAFLLLIAFANFTVSAELGLTSIAYSRLRRMRVAGEGGFENGEIVALYWLMGGLIILGAILIALAIAGGVIRTEHPTLFVAFYGVAALNLLAVLARRILAALDHNLWWEALDLLRRITGIGLLFASLLGWPILDSVLLQLAIALLLLGIGMRTIHLSLAMAVGNWLAIGRGAAHVRANYLADFGRTGALTLFDVAAYNAPYFTIAAATHDPRPLLLFDFLFKISRALSAIIRALIEAMLPGLTKAWFNGEMAAFRSHLRRAMGPTLAVTVAAGLGTLVVGRPLAHILFDGHLNVGWTELIAIAALLLGLGLICISVYLQNALGRFGALVRPSFLLLLGSLLSVPIALLIPDNFSLTFTALYAAMFVTIALVHVQMLRRLGERAAP